MSDSLKNLLGALPLTAEAYWLMRGKNKPWQAHYKLENLKEVLPQAVEDVIHFKRSNPNPRKICVFSTLHYWIEQSMLVALALSGQGHEVNFAWLPYAEWDREINRFDLRKQDLYTRKCSNRQQSDALKVCLPSLEAGEAKLMPELLAIVEHVSDYDTQYTLQIEETDFIIAYRLRNSATDSGSRAFRLVTKRKARFSVIPSGTILEMGVAYKIAGLLGIETVSFEFADQQEQFGGANDEIMSHNTALGKFGQSSLPEKAKDAMMKLFGARANFGKFRGQ